MMWKPMTAIDETLRGLARFPNVQVSAGASLALYTRFGLGGPADIYAETDGWPVSSPPSGWRD